MGDGPASDPDAAPAEYGCRRCGRPLEDNTLSWSRDEQGWLCPDCTRENVRSIEGRLDDAWW